MPFLLPAPFSKGEPMFLVIRDKLQLFQLEMVIAVIEADLPANLIQMGTKLPLQGGIALIALGSFDNLVICHFLVCLAQIFPMKNRLLVRMLSAVC